MEKYLYDADELAVSSSNTLMTNEDHFSKSNLSMTTSKSILKPRKLINANK